MIKKYSIVEVVWVDSTSEPDWVDLKEVLEQKTLHCTSVGYLVQETEDRLILVGSVGLEEPSMAASHITIPKVCISKVITLGHKKPKKPKVIVAE